MSLVSKNYEIERTIVQLENEISQIKQQHGEANKENIQQDFWQLLSSDRCSVLCISYCAVISFALPNKGWSSHHVVDAY